MQYSRVNQRSFPSNQTFHSKLSRLQFSTKRGEWGVGRFKCS